MKTKKETIKAAVDDWKSKMKDVGLDNFEFAIKSAELFVDWLREERAKQKLSLNKIYLLNKRKISKATLSMIETKKQKPYLYQFILIAKALGKDLTLPN